MRVQRLVEGVFAEVGDFVDGVGLADRIEDDAAFLGDVVDRELHGGGKTADDEIDLFLFDQLQRPRRGLAGIELVVAHQQLRLAAVEAAALVELGDGDFGGAHLILRLGAVRPGQRNRKADLDGGFLRLQQIDAERRGGQRRAGADRRQQAAAGNRSGFGGLLGHGVLHWIVLLAYYIRFCSLVLVQIRPNAVRITCGVSGISVMVSAERR